MIRTQIQLTEEQAAALKLLSAKTGVSIAELVRRGLEPLLRDARSHENGRADRALAIVGRFHSGTSDVAAEHDRYLAEAAGK